MSLMDSCTEARTCLSFDAGMSLRQRRILRTALRMFAEREYADVSLRDIAREAGVSLTLIDHHFGAKHALFTAVVRSWSATLEQAASDVRHAQAQGRVACAADLIALMLRPVGLLLDDPDGPPVLRLWARHRFSQELSISGPLDLAIGPFRAALEQGLERLYPASAGPDRAWALGMALSGVLEFAMTEPADGDRLNATPARAAMRQLLERHIEGGWHFALSTRDACSA
jgi:AcrR family transcriptional regulator